MSGSKSTVSTFYIAVVTVVSFLLAVLFFWLSHALEKVQSIFLSMAFIIIIVLVGIIADIIGVAVTAAAEAPLHAKASKKIPGALEGVLLIRNADRVANLMNDVIGDIAGTVSGALGIALVLQIMYYLKDPKQLVLNMLITATIAALTVGGKAAGKRIALVRSEEIVFSTGKFLYMVSRVTGKGLSPKMRKINR